MKQLCNNMSPAQIDLKRASMFPPIPLVEGNETNEGTCNYEMAK